MKVQIIFILLSKISPGVGQFFFSRIEENITSQLDQLFYIPICTLQWQHTHDLEWHWIIFQSTTMITAIFMNLALITLIGIIKELRSKPSTKLLMALYSTNFLFAIFTLFFNPVIRMIYPEIFSYTENRPNLLYICRSYSFLFTTFSVASSIALLVVAIDRYMFISEPLKYYSRYTTHHGWTMCLIIWGLSVFLGTPFGFLHYTTDIHVPQIDSIVYFHCEVPKSVIKYLSFILFLPIPITITMVILYSRIFILALKHLKAMEREMNIGRRLRMRSHFVEGAITEENFSRIIQSHEIQSRKSYGNMWFLMSSIDMGNRFFRRESEITTMARDIFYLFVKRNQRSTSVDSDVQDSPNTKKKTTKRKDESTNTFTKSESLQSKQSFRNSEKIVMNMQKSVDTNTNNIFISKINRRKKDKSYKKKQNLDFKRRRRSLLQQCHESKYFGSYYGSTVLSKLFRMRKLRTKRSKKKQQNFRGNRFLSNPHLNNYFLHANGNIFQKHYRKSSCLFGSSLTSKRLVSSSPKRRLSKNCLAKSNSIVSLVHKNKLLYQYCNFNVQKNFLKKDDIHEFGLFESQYKYKHNGIEDCLENDMNNIRKRRNSDLSYSLLHEKHLMVDKDKNMSANNFISGEARSINGENPNSAKDQNGEPGTNKESVGFSQSIYNKNSKEEKMRKHTISQAQRKISKQEEVKLKSKLGIFMNLTLMVGSYGFFLLPMTVMYMAQFAGHFDPIKHYKILEFIQWLSNMTVLLNPIVYGVLALPFLFYLKRVLQGKIIRNYISQDWSIFSSNNKPKKILGKQK